MDFKGYRRKDGRFDIECTLLDTKGYDMSPPGSNRIIGTGSPVHDMSIRLVVSDQLVVEEVHACSDATPFGICSDAASALQVIKGQRIAPGWSAMVKERLGGRASCTHLVEMLVAMGTAVYQTVVPQNRMQGKDTEAFPLANKVNSCYAYSEDGPLVKFLSPGAWKRS